MHDDPKSSSFDACFALTRFERWEPGVSICLRMHPATRLSWVVTMLLWGGCCGLILGALVYGGFRIFAGESAPHLPYWETFVIIAIPASVLGAAHFAGVETIDVIDIDWKSRRLSWSTRFRTRTIPLDDIQSLVLRAEYFERTVGPRREHRTLTEKVFHARLDAQLESEILPILSTDFQRMDATAALKDLAPVAQQLADSLSVQLLDQPSVRERHAILRPLARAPRVLHAALLVLMLASCTWIVWRAQPVRAIHQAHRTIKALGGRLATRDEWRIAGTQHGPVRVVNFANSSLTDDDLIALADALRLLERFELNLTGTRVTDRGLAALVNNSRLVHLNLHGTRVTDQGIKTLGDCPQLVELNLTRTRVTDAGMADLQRMSRLDSLRLWHTSVTDAAVENLRQMRHLRELYLNDTSITPAGLVRLKSALPNAKIQP